mmetsp:Transcript_1022/g.1622  ORF Transcript_1022/g.1622 Transcript_1022/m.1622 type:complete len:204 (+) Transcript_1022:661-1272(+)
MPEPVGEGRSLALRAAWLLRVMASLRASEHSDAETEDFLLTALGAAGPRASFGLASWLSNCKSAPSKASGMGAPLLPSSGSSSTAALAARNFALRPLPDSLLSTSDSGLCRSWSASSSTFFNSRSSRCSSLDCRCLSRSACSCSTERRFSASSERSCSRCDSRASHSRGGEGGRGRGGEGVLGKPESSLPRETRDEATSWIWR